MPLIKTSDQARSIQSVAFNLDDMAAAGRAQVAQAVEQAAAIVATAHREAESIRRQTESDAFAAAETRIEQLAQQYAERQLTTLLPALVQAIDASRQDWLRHWQVRSLEVAAAMAKRIVRRELTAEPRIALDLVREALELAVGIPQLQLSMHPEDLRLLGPAVTELCGELTRLSEVKIVTDESISRGGCRLETRFGQIDQQIESQLDRLLEELQ
ncbi:MAG: flagellar assembly protein FliH [Pirellulales bacterium]|nr:flagellar assembly protein FliH [Pirellulales bacterium]